MAQRRRRPAGPTRRPASRVLKAGGYTIVDGGRFQDGTEDFTSQISKFKAAGCDILSGVMIPPDFTNFWKQCFQQGFTADGRHHGKALLFPPRSRRWATSATASPPRSGGPRAIRSSRRSPARPARSSPTRTSRPHASSGRSRSCTTRSSRSSSTPSSAPRTSTTSRSSRRHQGHRHADHRRPHHLDARGKPLNPVPNVCVTPLTGGQWNKGTKYPFDIDVVNNS